MTDEALSSDLEDLRAEFAESGWRFGTMWASAASGPDRCRVIAYRDGVLLSYGSCSSL